MSRLYAWLDSDSRSNKQTMTSCGHEHLSFRANYGSSGSSSLAVQVDVTWKKGEDKPTIDITLPKGEKIAFNSV